MPTPKTAPPLAFAVVGVVGASAFLLVPLLVFGRPHTPIYQDPPRLIVWSLLVAAAMVWAVVFAWLAFGRTGEFEQTASKFAWYWGGSIGLAVSCPLFAFIAWGGLHWLMPSLPVGPQLFRAFVMGYGLAVGAQLVGFLIARAWWRATKR